MFDKPDFGSFFDMPGGHNKIPYIPMLIDLAGEPGSIQGPRERLFGDCAPHDPTQGRLSPVLALAVGVMFFLHSENKTVDTGPIPTAFSGSMARKEAERNTRYG